MKEEPKQNPALTIALIHFIITLAAVKYVTNIAFTKVIPGALSGNAPSFSLVEKVVTLLSQILSFPLGLVTSPLNLSNMLFYVSLALNSFIWGWVIMKIYSRKKIKA